MDIIGDRKFVEVPGGKTHELPPLLVKTVPDVKRLDKIMGVATRSSSGKTWSLRSPPMG